MLIIRSETCVHKDAVNDREEISRELFGAAKKVFFFTKGTKRKSSSSFRYYVGSKKVGKTEKSEPQ